MQGFLNKMNPESEPKFLFYGWTISEDGTKLFCRESYDDAEALLFHLQHVAEDSKALTAEGVAKIDSF